MTALSVNINKVAVIRNARGGSMPNVKQIAIDCQRFGADGITVHPRPDERHIKYSDVHEIKPIITTEFNIEGYPSQSFIDLILEVRPHQVTLVPDAPDAITSSAGWDTVKYFSLLSDLIAEFKKAGVRSSIFVGTDAKHIEAAAKIGTNRVELYTEPYATEFPHNKEVAIAPFITAAKLAQSLGLEINAGHDLSLENLRYLKQCIPFLHEVSIGHALISDALYFGLENTIQMYKRQLL